MSCVFMAFEPIFSTHDFAIGVKTSLCYCVFNVYNLKSYNYLPILNTLQKS